MLVVNKSSNNELILTITEKSTLTDPVYLFKFTSDYNSTSKYVIIEDTSDYTYRYNKFILTESVTEVLTSGTVNFNPSGFWSYEVYEQTSTSNLNPQLSDNTQPLERGKMLVIGDSITIKRHEPTNTTYKGYGTGQT